MRLLTLTPDQNRRYQIILFALLMSPEGLKKGEHGPHAKMVEKFGAIGARDPLSLPSGDSDPLPKYKLVGGDVVLEEQQYGLLTRLFEGSLEVYHKSLSGDVASCATWLAAIPSVEGTIPKAAPELLREA